jgi:class 3 adenylate cyclase/DNA-binding winged helix-turn-helix (wHTH) protein
MKVSASSEIFVFGDFRLDRAGGGLFRLDDQGAFAPVTIGSRALDLLTVLIERRGDVVSKDEIMTAVWPKIAVEEGNLFVQISALRTILDREQLRQSCIQTVSGRGYRFVTPVTRCASGIESDPSPGRHQRSLLGPSDSVKPPVRLAEAPPPEPSWTSSAERRELTVMVCELVGSAALSRLDPEELHKVIAAYRRVVAKTVGGFDGFVGKYMGEYGEALLVYFGYPTAQENDAERAVRAALAIQRALSEHSSEKAKKGAPELSARVGLDCGLVVVDPIDGVFGDAPNVAAHVLTAGEPGTVLVTTNVLRQVSGLFVTEERGESQLIGVLEPVNLFRVVRASGGRRRVAARPLTSFVGREEELGLLARRWERARAGESQLVLIVGEPGIGKSRLVEEFRATLAETSHTWVEWGLSSYYRIRRCIRSPNGVASDSRRIRRRSSASSISRTRWR